MKISLVTATLGRVKEVKNLLDSLVNQTYKNFELIIIDQNEHFELQNLIQDYNNLLNIKYIRSNKTGLSYNRNIGIENCTGEIIGFPDDDCFYSNNVLWEVFNKFNSYKYQLVLVEAIDPITKEIYIPFSESVTRKNLMSYSISYNIFLPLNEKVLFDENLGVGAYFSSGEETDYLWQQISTKDKIGFVKGSSTYHLKGGYQSLSFRKAYQYGLGFGALFKKEIFVRHNYSYLFMYIKYLFRSLGGLLITRKKKMYFGSLLGRIIGFIKYRV